MTRRADVRFGGRLYRFGETYEYQDLPETAQEDARNTASTEEDLEGEGEAKKYVYQLVLVPKKMAKRVVDKISKEIDVGGWSIDRMMELAEDIKEFGLGSPPTGAEGFHRLMALVELGMDVPYFKMINKRTGRGVGGEFFPS